MDNRKMVDDITSMDEDFAKWYTDIVKKAELVGYTSIKGCLVIRPYGYAIWENMQRILDGMFKATGHENVCMPMFIPESLLNKEKDHVEGFAPEVAWVTHGGSEKLEERLCVRPTSETLFCEHYSNIIHSYRDLPLRMAELGTVYRKEKSGALSGLTRVQGFTQDDAHIFCTLDQLVEEINEISDFVKDAMAIFKMEFEVELSTRPESYVGSLENWEKAEAGLKEALDKRNMKYDINEGDGAFYGPKIDFKFKDAIGRTWQCGTIQLDFNLPERFGLKYQDKDGSMKTPVMLHRVWFNGKIPWYFNRTLCRSVPNLACTSSGCNCSSL